MKFYNSNKAKAKLRRDNLKNKQPKTNFKPKSLLNKRIVEGHVEVLKNQQNEMLWLQARLEDVKEQIVNKLCNYQRLICVDLESTNKIKEINDRAYIAVRQHYFKEIDIKQCIQMLEEIDKDLTEIIENWKSANPEII